MSIPRDHRLGQLESPSLWRLEFRPDPDKHIALLSTKRIESASFSRMLGKQSTASGDKGALIFIHGYNVDFEDAARRAAQITYDLGFKGIPFFYSWPSNGKVLDYVADGEQARRASSYLRQFLELIAEQGETGEINLIAHSMGNRVLTTALQQLADRKPSLAELRIGQISLVAPDIDTEEFKNEIAPKIAKTGRRLTLYASYRDKALQISKELHNYPRVGDLQGGITIVSGMDTIDASKVDTSLIGHSYFADNRSVIADLFSLIRRDAAPTNRFGMRTMWTNGRKYWMFAP